MIEDQQRSIDEYTKDTDEYKQQIAELKQRVNEAEVEAKLQLQYLQRQIEGQQSCRDREYLKEETQLQEEIAKLEDKLNTENLVNKTVRDHLTSKQTELNQKGNERDHKREEEGEVMEGEKKRIQDLR